MLIYVYVFALVLGAILLGASLLHGGDDGGGDFDGHVDLDIDADLDADVDIDFAGDHDAHANVGGFFGVFGSTRFWTFFATFFGLTGLVLDGLALASVAVALGLALAVGILCGWSAVTLLRRLSASDTGRVAGIEDYVGKSGEMRLSVGPGRLGKVRISLMGTTVDVLAVCEDGEITRGEQALIVEMRDHKALVVKLGSSSSARSS